MAVTQTVDNPAVNPNGLEWHVILHASPSAGSATNTSGVPLSRITDSPAHRLIHKLVLARTTTAISGRQWQAVFDLQQETCRCPRRKGTTESWHNP